MADNYVPKMVGIEIVRGCNFGCKMCPVPLNMKPGRFKFMDLSLIKRARI